MSAGGRDSYRFGQARLTGAERKDRTMPRYLVERTFAGGLHIPVDNAGAEAVASVVSVNAEQGVTWVHSYVSADRTKTFCLYDGPSPEAIRLVAGRNGLPVDAITEVRVLDPYFYLDEEVTADAT
jgi:hypothetical protein